MNYIKTLRDQLQDMGEGFVESLPSLAIAIFIVFLTWIVARLGARISDIDRRAHRTARQPQDADRYAGETRDLACWPVHRGNRRHAPD